MKQLVNAVKEVYHTISPIEDAFAKYAAMDNNAIENHTATYNDHILLQAFLVLKKGGYQYSNITDIQDFEKLVTLIKKVEEVNNEGKKSKARRKTLQRRVRLHHRTRRPLPA